MYLIIHTEGAKMSKNDYKLYATKFEILFKFQNLNWISVKYIDTSNLWYIDIISFYMLKC